MPIPIPGTIQSGAIMFIKVNVDPSPPTRYKEFHYIGGPYDGKVFIKPEDTAREVVRIPVHQKHVTIGDMVLSAPPIGAVMRYEYFRCNEGNRIVMRVLEIVLT